jgi:hypothetical protein
LGLSPTILQYDPLEFLNDPPLFKVNHQGVNCNVSIDTIVPIGLLNPISPAIPTAVLTGPMGAVSLCMPVILTLKTIQNSGMRPLQNFRWSLTNVDPPAEDIQAILGTVCDAATANDDDQLTIPMLTMG